MVEGLGRAFGSVTVTGRIAACFCCARPKTKCFRSALICTLRLDFQASIAVVGKAWFQGGCAWFGEVPWRRLCVSRYRDPRPVVVERVVAGLATTRRTGGKCRCGLAMGNSVAPVVHLLFAHHKDSQCSALMHRSAAECTGDGAKRKRTRRCCLLHLDGAASASDDAVEGDAEAGVQAAVGVAVE